MDEGQDLTAMLRRWSNGDESALEQITPLVYSQLRSLAAGYLRRERNGHTLQPTALIHEAYIRLIDQHQSFDSRRQFYGVAAHLMRLILVDYARAHQAAKRGGHLQRMYLDDAEPAATATATALREANIVALDEALRRLASMDERKSRAVELRYFGGLQAQEIAELLGISAATLRRELRFAENWLCTQLSGSPMSDSLHDSRSKK